ncbi:hypothetical protein F4809DRAFT_165704 [Biscogniauxia mediterranea]|nr:hypothetical protein F4809DRAFT_165704 [Biscogniauxia mediterranea]
MDHFNATVFNGYMVATRRGFQVSKQRHQGTAFVNSSVQEIKQQTSTHQPAYSLPTRNTQLTFITNGEDEKKLAPPRRRTRRSKSPSDKPTSAGVVKAKRLSRISASRRQSSCSLSSTSSEDRQTKETPEYCSSDPSTLHSPRLLPAWTCYNLQPDVPVATKRILFVCLAFAPGEGYADDGLSLESSVGSLKEDLSSIRDPTSRHCALTLGTLFDTMTSRRNGDSPDLESLTSQLSFIVNRRLNDKSEDESERNITIHAVATLAVVAGYLGRHDHWYVHMSGLLRLIDMAGGQNVLDARTINTIRKADFVGAVFAATKPCVPFMRRRAPLRCPLPVLWQDYITRNLTRHLSACGLDLDIISAITDAAIFGKFASGSLGGTGTLNLEGDAAMEHYYSLGYRLLSQPEPLRRLDHATPPNTSPDFVANVSPLGAKAHTWDMGPNPCSKAIESAMRILALLYIREPTFDIPCGNDAMLNLLEENLRIILDICRAQSPADLLIDPLLLQDPMQALRPTLIWMCLAADLIATLKNTPPPAGRMDSFGQAALICQGLLRHVLGPQVSANLDLVSDADLEVCRLLDLGCLTGHKWDDRQAIKNVLGIYRPHAWLL